MAKRQVSLPKLSNYGEYSSDNYGFHTVQVSCDLFTLYFSYKTLVAFCTNRTGLVVHENVWGPTTGKHINFIDSGRKERRVSAEEFEKMWDKFVAGKIVGRPSSDKVGI